MTKTTKALLATAGTTIVAATVFASVVLNYDTPYYEHNDLVVARALANELEAQYSTVYDSVVDNTPGRYALVRERDSLYNVLDYTGNKKQVLKRIDQLDSIESEIVTRALNNSKQLDNISKSAMAVYEDIEKLEHDRATCDSIANTPVKKRFVTNWNAMRTDYHKSHLMFHQNRLKKLQNQK